MKKTLPIITILALLCAILISSCNGDATIGIYAEVAASTPNKNVTLVNYLGQDSGDRYYYQLDDGVYRIGTSDALFKSSGSTRIIGSYLNDSDDSLYIMRETIPEDVSKSTVELYQYTAPYSSSGTKVTWTPSDGEVMTRLFTNGVVLSNKNVYYFSTATTLEKMAALGSDLSIKSGMESEDYIFISLHDNDTDKDMFYVMLNDGTEMVSCEADSKAYCGFQYYGEADSFLLFQKDSSSNRSYAKKITDTGVADYLELKSSLVKAYVANASFHNPADPNQVIVKGNNYFDVIDLSAGTVTQVNKDFAADICTADISNFKIIEGTHKVVVGTVESLLYLIDMDHTDKNPVEIN